MMNTSNNKSFGIININTENDHRGPSTVLKEAWIPPKVEKLKKSNKKKVKKTENF